MYTVKDSFDTPNKINQILPDVHKSDELVFVSLDVVSLSTNVPLKSTVDIVLNAFILANNLQLHLPKYS